ncbi:hypothetical protein BDV59DRAFT_196623 [Aspergillus ambiguus]|uniref:uncharacterized protein n=1 Tax=Aspergillus ambiguus TaxID=176160 RepID=UPI003CCD2719
MAADKRLGSPIELPLRRATAPPEAPLPPIPSQTDTRNCNFIKYGSPYDQLGRVFIGFSRSWNGVDAIEFQEGSAVGFVNHCAFESKDLPLEHIVRVSHPNILDFKEIFLCKGNIYFLYWSWGVTLKEIRQLFPVFQLSEVEVAIVCRSVLRALTYLHKDLDICFGELSSTNVLITKEGEVKIAGMGQSLLKRPKSNSTGKARDVQAVCSIARKLLRLDDVAKVRGTIGLLAEDFSGAPPTATADDLLKHPFLQVDVVPWCLAPVHMLYTVARDRKQELGGS